MDDVHLNMSQLVQNPGRPSQGSEQGITPPSVINIFAKKVRKPAKKGKKKAPLISHEEFDAASFGEMDNNSDEIDSSPNSDKADKEFNLKQEIEFEAKCLSVMQS